MEADSLAQAVEMSAVPWPLLKLWFSVISNLQEIVRLPETAGKDLSRVMGEISVNLKCHSLYTLCRWPSMLCCFCQ